MEQILTLDQIKKLGKQLKQQDKLIVLVGGCFDLLHLGHITLLEEAKKQGDILIVLLESDKRIGELKGSNRPLHTQSQRAQMLSNLKSVDYIILLPDKMIDQDYDMVVKQLQPAIIASTEGTSTQAHIERQAKLVNAQIYLVQSIQNLSTSRILDVVAKEL